VEHRAVREEDKQRKHQLILDAALRLFKRDRRLHTAAVVAQEAKIAKGTLYLYFATKEEIYMDLLVHNFSRWHETLRNFILDGRPTAAQTIELMCRSLADFTVFVDLVSLASVLLEENLSVDYVRKARLMMRQESIRSCQLISRSYPAWSEDECLIKLRRFYTYSIAYWKECFPSVQVVAALPEEFGCSQKVLRERYFEEILVMNRLIWGPLD
jgi:AcrR family transcriptional regulator